MRKLLEKRIQSLHDAVVGGHDSLQNRVLQVDGDIHLIFGQIDFKGFGFYHIR